MVSKKRRQEKAKMKEEREAAKRANAAHDAAMIEVGLRRGGLQADVMAAMADICDELIEKAGSEKSDEQKQELREAFDVFYRFRAAHRKMN